MTDRFNTPYEPVTAEEVRIYDSIIAYFKARDLYSQGLVDDDETVKAEALKKMNEAEEAACAAHKAADDAVNN